MSDSERIAALERELVLCREQRAIAEDSERRVQMFLESVQDYAFIGFDLDIRVIGWSGGAERILGYPQAEALGLYGSVFFTPEDVVKGEFHKEIIGARVNGRAEDERWHVRRDGSRFWGSGVMAPLIGPDGQLRGYCKVMRDQTARRLAEARVRSSEERLRLFTENVSDYALVSVDLEGLVSGWNAGAVHIFGYSADDIIGRHYTLLFSPEDIASGEPEQDLRRAMVEGRSENEREMLRSDGRRFWARGVTTPIVDEHEQLRGFAKVLQDNTERKQAREQRERLLHDQVRSRGEALDRTKEELRALAASLLTAQEDERRRIARELHDELAQRLAGLSNKLFKLRAALPDEPASLQAGARQLEQDVSAVSNEVRLLSHRLHPSILDDLGLAPALRRLLEEFAASRGQPATFEARAMPESLSAATAGALYRITQEALRNVSKHGGAGPVRVLVEGEPDCVRLRVEDEGPGFDPAEVRGRGGLGIISMGERARLVGGTLHIESVAGRGTRVRVDVPLAGADGQSNGD